MRDAKIQTDSFDNADYQLLDMGGWIHKDSLYTTNLHYQSSHIF